MSDDRIKTVTSLICAACADNPDFEEDYNVSAIEIIAAIDAHRAATPDPRDAEIARMRDALEQCAEWFRVYGDNHDRKNNSDGTYRNYDRAAFAVAAADGEILD